MAGRSKQTVEVVSERTKIPADGQTATNLCLRFPAPHPAEVKLRLSRRGSFSSSEIIRETTLKVSNGEATVLVYAPKRPGTGYLSGEGFRHKLDFVAASFMQGLIFEWVPTLFWALLIALVLRNYAVASYFIPSGSMEDTLFQHDMLIANKLSYKLLQEDPQRGDIMIFQYPNDRSKDYIKRVIGVPGDTIEVKDGTVYVNGEPQAEDYIKEPPLRYFPLMTIPEAEYFMMGDNRNHSQDSRVWGTVPRSYFEGRALFIFWPPQRMGLVDTPTSHSALAAE